MNKITPKLRKEVFVELVSTIIRIIENNTAIQFPFKNCLNCEHFNEKDELCRYWKAKPPSRVICYGCDQHTDIGDIPF